MTPACYALVSIRIVLAVLALACTNRVQAGLLIASTSHITPQAYVEPAFEFEIFTDATSIPFHTNLAKIAGNSSYDVTINYSASGGQSELDHQFDLIRDGNAFDLSQINAGIRFTVDADATYDVTGSFSVVDVDNGDPGSVFFRSRLRDIGGTDIILFDNFQHSLRTTNESFALGGTLGDTDNLLIGSQTGYLQAGHDYLWEFIAYVSAEPDSDDGASATGYATLTVGETNQAVVPEPSSHLAFVGLFTAYGLAGWLVEESAKDGPLFIVVGCSAQVESFGRDSDNASGARLWLHVHDGANP